MVILTSPCMALIIVSIFALTTPLPLLHLWRRSSTFGLFSSMLLFIIFCTNFGEIVSHLQYQFLRHSLTISVLVLITKYTFFVSILMIAKLLGDAVCPSAGTWWLWLSLYRRWNDTDVRIWGWRRWGSNESMKEGTREEINMRRKTITYIFQQIKKSLTSLFTWIKMMRMTTERMKSTCLNCLHPSVLLLQLLHIYDSSILLCLKVQ